MTVALAGGGNIPYEGAVPTTPVYLGLDWFLLNLLLLAVVFILLEKVWPHRVDQSVFRRGWTTDTVYFFMSHLLVQVSTLLTLIGRVIRPCNRPCVRSQPCCRFSNACWWRIRASTRFTDSSTSRDGYGRVMRCITPAPKWIGLQDHGCMS
jgi:hypothetical protein